MNCCSNLGAFASPILIGWMLSAHTTWTTILILTAVCNGMAALLWLLVNSSATTDARYRSCRESGCVMRVGHLLATIVASVSLFAALKTSAQTTAPIRDKRSAAPVTCSPRYMPGFGWRIWNFNPRDTNVVDLIASRSDFGLLTSSLRSPRRELTLPATHDQIKEGVEYARTKGIRVAMDLDVRLARMAFRKKYPNELQWQTRLRQSNCSPNGPTIINIEPIHLSDHMTYPGR